MPRWSDRYVQREDGSYVRNTGALAVEESVQETEETVAEELITEEPEAEEAEIEEEPIEDLPTDEYETWTKPMLETELSSRGLVKYGSKATLIARLRESDAA